jgi:hypothetical protein
MSFDFMAVLLSVVVVRCLYASLLVQGEWHGSNTGGSVLATDLRIAYRFAYAPVRLRATGKTDAKRWRQHTEALDAIAVLIGSGFGETA